MKVKQLLIIPNYKEIENYIELANQYDAGFEYNDFFLPGFLDDEKAVEDRIQFYQSKKEKYPEYCTSHGVFLDITVFSDDSKIKQVADERIHQSMNIAKKLNARAVVFHTNYIANFLLESYRENWVLRNEEYFRKLCTEYPDINIYMENMFDDSPVLLARLAEKMKEVSNFGICFDYAHAHVFGDESKIDEWVKALAPYVKHLHINDNDFVSDSHEALGDGKIDWTQFKEVYEKYFTNVSVLLEVSGYEKAKKSLEFFDKL